MNESTKRSAYMHWAKMRSAAKFNLATSGLQNVSIRDFPIHTPEMEITGPGGYGYQPLQERIAQHTGAPVECVVAATGASMANYLAMSVVLEPGDEVLIEQPAYGLFAEIANYLQAQPRFFSRPFKAGFEVAPETIRAALTSNTRLIVLSNLHNPSGALIDRETLSRIAELAAQHGVRVLMDEAYLEMMFDPDAPFAFPIGASIGADSNPFISTNSLTKTYGLSGLRCGWVLASAELAAQMWRLNDLFGVNAAYVVEQMSVAAFEQLDRVRTNAQSLLTANRRLLMDFLDAHPELECFRPPAGSVVFPKLPGGPSRTGISPDRFFALLRDKYETSVVPGEFFGMPDHFRVGIAADTDMVREGLQRLGAALGEFLKE